MGTEKKNKKTMPEGMEINLCDFALFLSVMKNKEAHEITLSIIMENPDLHLEDGTTKIFLNMSSKNGTPELVSLLQYMKKTTLDNPNIVLHDERLCKLDSIVNEITESEEWEDVKMSIYSSGLERGREMGKEIGKEIGEKIGKEIGKDIGKEVGQLSHRMELICKKLKKEKTLEEVAEELEEDIDTIRPIYEFASRFAPEYDWEKITEAWFERKKQI